MWQRPDLWTQARTWADLVTAHIDADQNLDIIGGAAGCIGGLAALYRTTRDDSLLPLIARCADHLLSTAQPTTAGRGWVVPGMGGLPLAGFSHGASGFAWALLLAADLYGNRSYRAAAEDALSYERTLFDATAGNWRDLRSEDGEAPVDATSASAAMYAWCHGAPGIGLARLTMLGHLDDSRLRQEIDVALASTAAQGMGGGHSLCHGDLGNIELLVKASQVLGDADLLAGARSLAADVLTQQAHTGWICGVPNGVETPGLMVGLAGMGYQLLRISDPTRVPSILLMEGPK